MGSTKLFAINGETFLGISRKLHQQVTADSHVAEEIHMVRRYKNRCEWGG